MIEYEDTIMPEQGPCACCGMLVDEGDNYAGPQDNADAFVCEDCADERREE